MVGSKSYGQGTNKSSDILKAFMEYPTELSSSLFLGHHKTRVFSRMACAPTVSQGDADFNEQNEGELNLVKLGTKLNLSSP